MFGNLFDVKSLAGPAFDSSNAIQAYLKSMEDVLTQAGGEDAPQELKDSLKKMEECSASAEDCAKGIEAGAFDEAAPVVLEEEEGFWNEHDHDHSHDLVVPGTDLEGRDGEDVGASLENALSEGVPAAGGASPSVPEATASAVDARGRASAALAEARVIHEKGRLGLL